MKTYRWVKNMALMSGGGIDGLIILSVGLGEDRSHETRSRQRHAIKISPKLRPKTTAKSLIQMAFTSERQRSHSIGESGLLIRTGLHHLHHGKVICLQKVEDSHG